MSRSRRKKPIIGITAADSEKDDKRKYNRRFRHAFNRFLGSLNDSKPEPTIREYSNPWSMAKDGKLRFNSNQHPKLMRK